MSIFAVSSQKVSTETPCEIFAVSRPIITKIATNVEKIVPFITSKAELRYLNPLRNTSMLNKGHFANFAQNRLPSTSIKVSKRGPDLDEIWHDGRS